MGLENISVPEQRVLLLLTLLLVIYYLVAFALYVARDCLTLVAVYLGNVDDDLVYPQATADQHQLKAIEHRQRFWERRIGLRRTAWAFAIPRWLIDALFPLVLGFYAACVLWP